MQIYQPPNDYTTNQMLVKERRKEYDHDEKIKSHME